MRLPGRRAKVPDHVRAAIGLEPPERVLAAAESSEGTYLVATDRALFVVVAGSAERLRWDLIDRASWQPPSLVLEHRAGERAPLAVSTISVDQRSDLPAIVRDRVTNSIVVNSQVAVTGGHARVVARRNADTGALQWRVSFGQGVDPADPDVRQAAQEELDDLRSRLGV